MNPWIIIGWIVLVSMIGFYLIVLIDFIQYYYGDTNEHQRLHDRTQSD